MDNNSTYSDDISARMARAYDFGYHHGMLSVNQLVESLQRKLASAHEEINRLQEVISEKS